MKKNTFQTGLAVAALSLAFPLAASAQGKAAEPAQSTFDVSVLAGACFNCHGTDGKSPGAIPAIAGRPESVLLMQLQSFKADPPPAGVTVMNRHVKGYSDEELAALARYFSQVKR